MEESSANENNDSNHFVVIENGVNSPDNPHDNSLSIKAQKISKIIEKEFDKEIKTKKVEILNIFETLQKAVKTLHFLRMSIVRDYYHKDNLLPDDSEDSKKQYRPHPTVNASAKKITLADMGYPEDCFAEFYREKRQKLMEEMSDKLEEESKKKEKNAEIIKQLIKKNSSVPDLISKQKMKKYIVVGNVSKWIGEKIREDDPTHKWIVYVTDANKDPNSVEIAQYISKVRFFLHQTYKPYDVIDITSPPFLLSRHGWGEFDMRIQIHFSNGINKPVNIIHQLKLDQKNTGLYEPGQETIANIYVSSKIRNFNINEEINTDNEITNYDLNSPSENLESMNHSNDSPHSQVNLLSTTTTKNESLNQNEKTIMTESMGYEDSCKPLDNIKLQSTDIFKDKKMDSDNSNDVLQHSGSMSNSINYNALHQNNFLEDNNVVNFEKYCQSVVNFINQSRVRTLSKVLKLVFNRLPLNMDKVNDPCYMSLPPYAHESISEFNKCSKVKQRALERYRAISALNIINKIDQFCDTCSVNELIVWARRYYFTPIYDLTFLHKYCQAKNVENIVGDFQSTSTVLSSLNQWIKKCQKTKSKVNKTVDESDEEIDVLNAKANVTRLPYSNDCTESSNNLLISIEYPDKKNSLQEFVDNTTQQIGIKLVNEEVVQGVSHNSSNLLITKSVECLFEDLLRTSFSCAIDRCKREENFVIEPNDVRMALIKREEFSILSNVMLGSQD
ncbi:uncharacterized protein LOC106658802 [Trichogramma pretiosum]|uniref:uncharacterized protein LOC106658802 n=1 Tax=Trichogramma pretiosum TaxID=7493 RepID=UPI0006C9C9F8|nr:uncharacterized protein LOC106658802 [Trichogramma pretiosum]